MAYDANFTTVVLTEDLTFLNNTDIRSTSSPRIVTEFWFEFKASIGYIISKIPTYRLYKLYHMFHVHSIIFGFKCKVRRSVYIL